MPKNVNAIHVSRIDGLNVLVSFSIRVFMNGVTKFNDNFVEKPALLKR